MAAIMGLGTTHAPTLWKIPEEMTSSLRRTLAGKNLAPHMRDPRSWPEAMRAEWADDQGTAAGREYNRRCFAATRDRPRLGGLALANGDHRLSELGPWLAIREKPLALSRPRQRPEAACRAQGEPDCAMARLPARGVGRCGPARADDLVRACRRYVRPGQNAGSDRLRRDLHTEH